MRFQFNILISLLFSTWLAVCSARSVLDTSPVVRYDPRSLGLVKREGGCGRSKCSSQSCCQLPPSNPSKRDVEELGLTSRSLESRALFSYTDDTLDAEIVKRFTENKVTLIFSTSAGNDESTSAWKQISAEKPKSRAFDLGLSALCGCTALIVYSQNGAYGAHFFEAAAWGLGDAAFQENVVDFLNGKTKASGGLAFYADTLAANKAEVGAYILTPQQEFENEEDGTSGYVDGELMYGDQIQSLVEELPKIVPALEGKIEVKSYQALEGGRNEDGTDINPQQAKLLDETSRGRVLFQYDPNDDGSRKVRLFFETDLVFPPRILGPAK